MSDSLNDWAFPHTVEGNQGPITYQGMTLRDYFAGLALPSIIISKPELTVGEQVSEAFMYAEGMLVRRAK